MAGIDLAAAVERQSLPQDFVNHCPVDMGQYQNVFGNNLDGTGRWRSSSSVSQIGVVYKGWLFAVGLAGRLDATTVANELSAILCSPVKDSPGQLLLTAMPGRMRQQMVSSDAQQPDPSELPTFLFTLCLDFDSFPARDVEVGRLAQVGSCENRWFTSSCQIVVFGNAKAAVLLSFSAGIDGNVMAHIADELQARASRLAELPSRDERARGSPMRVRTPTISPHDAEIARRCVRSLTSDQQVHFVMEGFGRSFFHGTGLPVVGAFVLAVNYAVTAITGCRANVRQFVAQNIYRGLGTRQVATSTALMHECCSRLAADPISDNSSVVREAVDEYKLRARQARAHVSNAQLRLMHQTMMSPRRRSINLRIENVGRVLAAALGVASPVAPWKVVLSHPTTYSGVRLVGRPGLQWPPGRISIHYQFESDRNTLLVSAPADVSTLQLVNELKSACTRIAAAMTREH